MKAIYDEGCMSHHVSFDDSCLIFMDDLDEIIDKTTQVINKVSKLSNNKNNFSLISAIEDLMEASLDVIQNVVKYGTKEDEEIITHILDTKNFRIRSLYDCVSSSTIYTCDEDELDEDSTNEQLCKVLLDVFDKYLSTPRFSEIEDIKITINSFLSEIIKWYGVIEKTHHCDCCGDTVYTYILEI